MQVTSPRQNPAAKAVGYEMPDDQGSLFEDLRFAAGLLTILFAIGNLLDHLGVTGGEPRHTYIVYGCVLSALIYVGFVIADNVRRKNPSRRF